MKSLFLLVSCCASVAAVAESTPPNAKPLSQAAQEMVQHLPQGCIVTAHKVGGNVVFAGAGKLEPAGIAPKRILFEIGSLTKVFTGLLLAQAVHEGKVTLDTTVEQLLENQPLADSSVGRITLRQLATHTSGLPGEPDDLHVGADPMNSYAHYSRKRLLAFLSRTELKGKSPFPSHYSNLGMGLLGDLLSQVYGKPWDELVAEKITRPLGMNDTSMSLTHQQQRRFAPAYRGTDSVTPWTFKALAGAGSLKSSASDLVRFGEAIIDPQKTPLKDAFDILLKPHVEAGERGLAIARYKSFGQQAYGHDGLTFGYGCVFEVVPAEESVTVILINNGLLNGREVIARSDGKETRYDLPERIVSTQELTEYEGVYLIDDPGDEKERQSLIQLKNGRFTMEVRGNRLYGQLSGLPHREPYLPLYLSKVADRFFLRQVDAEYQFSRKNGDLTSVTLIQWGMEITGHKESVQTHVNKEKAGPVTSSRNSSN